MKWEAIASNLGRTILGAALSTGCLMLAGPGGLHAQVLEIGDGGKVLVHNGPEVISDTGVVPIRPSPRRTRSYALPAATAPSGIRPAGTANMKDAAKAAALSPDLVEAVAWRESGLNTAAVSARGAIGQMQLMPATARGLGVDRFDPQQNLNGGAAYLGALLKRYDGDMVRALAAYNAGPGAVDRYGGVPPYKETRDYVAAVLERLSRRAESEVQR